MWPLSIEKGNRKQKHITKDTSTDRRGNQHEKLKLLIHLYRHSSRNNKLIINQLKLLDLNVVKI